MQAPANPITFTWSNPPVKDYTSNLSDGHYSSEMSRTDQRNPLSYQLLSDTELLRSMRQDNKQAFDELYKRYWRSIFNLAYYKLKDKDASMDILQDLFISFWNHRSSELEIHSIQAYFFAAVKFKIANLIRHNKVRESFYVQAERTQIKQPTQSDDFETKQLKEVIARFTAVLPDKCKQIFFMSRNEFLSNKEIARRLNISEKTVENQMTLALRKLRGYLKTIL